RLLRVLPSTDSGSEIKCELFHSTIRRHKLSYVALSYAWGDPADTVMIKVNSKPLLITRNLASALRTVRSLQIRTIWADAICIDQQNTLERNNQVGRMSEIYSCASYVLAYTGESIENCDEAFALLRKDRPSTRNTADYAQDIADRAKDEKTTPLWVALKLLYSRPWFRRCWVTQEV
ncbi:heterokaryon incompatibility, partial [Lepidopterella palustris CBS 459.81]